MVIEDIKIGSLDFTKILETAVEPFSKSGDEHKAAREVARERPGESNR